MKMRLLLLLVIAISTAAGTAYLARNWLVAQRAALQAGQQQPGVITQVVDQVTVLVAAKELPAGRILDEDDLEWRNWPEESVGEDFIVFDEGKKDADKDKALEVLAGSVLRHVMPAGTPMQKNRVVAPGERGFLAAVLSPGTRAVSVPVDATSGIAGFVFPGDRVDLILTFKINKDGRTESQASQTVLEDIRVLAIDQATANEEGEAKLAKTATLEVSRKDGEKVALALRAGRLTLALRSLAANDDTAIEVAQAQKAAQKPWTLETDLSKLMTQSAAPVADTGGSAAPAKPVVTVLRGGQAQ